MHCAEKSRESGKLTKLNLPGYCFVHRGAHCWRYDSSSGVQFSASCVLWIPRDLGQLPEIAENEFSREKWEVLKMFLSTSGIFARLWKSRSWILWRRTFLHMRINRIIASYDFPSNNAIYRIQDVRNIYLKSHRQIQME